MIELTQKLKKLKLGNRYAIITDSKVERLYGIALLRNLKKNGIEAELFSFKEGEISKNLKTVETLAEQMVEKGFDRKDAIIALGGGVVGDMAGFLASIYMRGIPYVQIPTTLLAMVDSSIGGKTGVDLPQGKNLLGTFQLPKAILLDLRYIKTLSQQQIRNGLAEVIKTAVIKDQILFKFIEQNLDKILALEETSVNHIVKRCIEIKSKVVKEDEKEKDLRQILNYGHTYGHVIEKMSGFKLLHGYAISIGMVLANKFAVEKKLLKAKDADRIKNLLQKAGLPITTMKKPTFKDLSFDKKRTGNVVNFILPTKIGKVVIYPIKCL